MYVRQVRARTLLAAIITLAIATDAVRSQEPQKNVLMLSEYRPETQAELFRLVRGGLEAVYGERLNYFTEHIDAQTFDEDYRPALREYFSRKYHRHQFDVVLVIGKLAAAFVKVHGAEVFKDAPTVAVLTLGNGAELFDDWRTKAPVTGLIDRYDPKGTLEFILKLQPDTQRVHLVVGAGKFDGDFLAPFTKRELRGFERTVELTYWIGLPVDALVARVASAGPGSVIMFLRMTEDQTGRRMLSSDVLAHVIKAATVPVYGVASDQLAGGIVGGMLGDSEIEARTLVETALRILKGERAQDIPIRESPDVVPMANWHQLRRWGLEESRLPAGTIVRYRDASAWELHRWYIIGAFSLVTLQTLLIAGLLTQRASRRRAEQDIRDKEAALRKTQDRYELATSAGRVGVWDWNLETNRIYVDPGLKAILGYEHADIGDHVDDWSRLVHPDDLVIARARTREYLEGKTAACEMEHRLLHRDGTVRWFLVRASAIRLDGRLVRVIGTNTDITERKRAEQQLNEAQAELARVSRLTALGEFAASIAHEVRQPLTAIIASARASLRFLNSGATTEAREALSYVLDAGKRAEQVIERNRELFRSHTVQRDPLDINSVIIDATVMARPRLQSGQVSLATSLAEGLPIVEGDRIQLHQVLLNLIVNAIDAMDTVDPATRQLEISTARAASGGVQVSVCDNGIGLGVVDLERLFTLSYTTKATGTGVGLSISRSIVEAHGGELWAEQNVRSGATFSFTVPTVGS